MSDTLIRIGGFQKLTLLDYPGMMACIVFTAGCNFRCPFCQNAGLVSEKRFSGTVPAQKEIFQYLKKRRGILDGVVISGGEPLMQEGIEDFIRDVKGLGFWVKVDTNGSFPDRLEDLMRKGLIDYAAMDIKSGRSGYEAASGRAAGDILPAVERSIDLLKEAAAAGRQNAVPEPGTAGEGFSCEFRTTLVKGIHSREDVEEIAERIGNDVPYYLQSYSDAGDILKPEGLSSFSEPELQKMLDAARRHCRLAQLR